MICERYTDIGGVRDIPPARRLRHTNLHWDVDFFLFQFCACNGLPLLLKMRETPAPQHVAFGFLVFDYAVAISERTFSPRGPLFCGGRSQLLNISICRQMPVTIWKGGRILFPFFKESPLPGGA